MQNHTTCPNDETLMDFLAHRLDDLCRERVEQHLVLCSPCREQVAVCAGLLLDDPAGESATVPDHVTRKAVDAILNIDKAAGLTKLRRETRRWMARGAEALERLVWQPRPVGVAVRGREETLSPDVIHRQKQFGDLQVTIEIEKYDAGQALIRVDAGTGPRNAGPVRVALYQEDREAASSVLDREPVAFEEIPPGVYTLVFARKGRNLGEYAFEIVDFH